MAEPGSADEVGGEPDPFENVTLDEDFIRAAPVREPTAADRERAAREANLSRLLSDEDSLRANQLHELHRYAPSDDDFDEWDRWVASPERHRRRRSLRVVALLLVLSVVVVYVLADYLRMRGDGDSEASAASTSAEGSRPPGDAVTAGATSVPDLAAFDRPAEWPPLPTDVAPVPLGQPAAVPADGGSHSFTALQRDGVTPVGYDPCRPVRFVTRPGGPDAGAQLVTDAVAMVSAATGLQFVAEGTTDEAPSDERAAYQPERYGERWAPVLIAWSDEEESPLLGRSIDDASLADVAGYAGSQSVGLAMSDPATGETIETGRVFVTGSVVLDADDLTEVLDRADGYALARAAVAHELAHLVGLGHVDDPAQLMHPEMRASVTGFGSGDQQGLARLGTLSCFPQI